jgi:5'-methylthioinosine phosphorylase
VPTLAPTPFHDEVCALLKKEEYVFESGVYGQANGPRFETRAEIRFLATVADVVGMTAAEEATLVLEREMAFALLCMVDNPANGVEITGNNKLTTADDFHSGVAGNQATIDRLAKTVVDGLGNGAA